MPSSELSARVFCHAYPPVSALQIAQASAAWVARGGLPFEETSRALARIRRAQSATPRRLASWFLHPDPTVAIAATTHQPLWDAARSLTERTQYAYAMRVAAEQAAGVWWSPVQDAGPSRYGGYYSMGGRRPFEALPECAASLIPPAAVRGLADHLTLFVEPVLAAWVTTPDTLAPLVAYTHPGFQRALAQSAGGWTPALVRTFVHRAPECAEILATNPTLDAACLAALTTWALAHFVDADSPHRPAHWPALGATPTTWTHFSQATSTLLVLTFPQPIDPPAAPDLWTADARTAAARREADDAAAEAAEDAARAANAAAAAREAATEAEAEGADGTVGTPAVALLPPSADAPTAPPLAAPRVTLDAATWATLAAGLPRIPVDETVPGHLAPPTAHQRHAAALGTRVGDCLQILWETVPRALKAQVIQTRRFNEYGLSDLARRSDGDPALALAILDRGNTDHIRTEIARQPAAVADDAVWAILRTSRSLAVHQAVVTTSDRPDRRTESLERLARQHPQEALALLRRMSPAMRATYPASALLPAFVTAPLDLRVEAMTLLADMAPATPPVPRRRPPPAARVLTPG